MSVAIKLDLGDVREFFEELPEVAEKSMSLAMNQVTERQTLPGIRDEIQKQVNFPVGYLNQDDRLGITKKASPKNLEVVITGRDRPTSLARFAPGQTPASSRAAKGVVVTVKRGKSKSIPNAFIVGLKSGNIGLAVRLRAGERLKGGQGIEVKAWGGRSGNVYLLYGPSVDQVFGAVADDTSPTILDDITNEFFRQFARLSRG